MALVLRCPPLGPPLRPDAEGGCSAGVTPRNPRRRRADRPEGPGPRARPVRRRPLPWRRPPPEGPAPWRSPRRPPCGSSLMPLTTNRYGITEALPSNSCEQVRLAPGLMSLHDPIRFYNPSGRFHPLSHPDLFVTNKASSLLGPFIYLHHSKLENIYCQEIYFKII